MASEGDALSRAFDVFIISLILLNVTAVILETLEGLSERAGSFFWWFEVFSVAVFSLEYLLRLWSCTSDSRYSHPLWGRLRFALTPMAIVDLVAVLPFYIPFVTTLDMRFLRLLRLLRVFKMTRYSESMRILGSVLRAKRGEMILTMAIVLLVMVFASCLMYFAEHASQPEVFSSIPHTMWWAVATLSTVGYGDVFPITPLGKVIGGIVAFLGVGMFALPAGMLASGFLEEVRVKKECPHCGREID